MEEIVRKVEAREAAPRPGGEDGARREIVISVEAETLERQRKLARVRSGSGTGSTFEMLCDESARVGATIRRPLRSPTSRRASRSDCSPNSLG